MRTAPDSMTFIIRKYLAGAAIVFMADSANASEYNETTLYAPGMWVAAVTLITASIVSVFIFRYIRRSLVQLKQSQQQLDWALSGSGDGLWDWDIVSGTVTRKGVQTMLNYSEHEFKDTTDQLFELMHPEDVPVVNRELERHLSGLAPQIEIEYRLLDKSGRWHWILDKGKVVKFDKKGRPLRAAGIQTDITERKQAEDDLRLSAEVIQSMNEVVILTDDELKVCLVNNAFVRVMGLNEDEVLGKPLHHFFSSRHDRAFYNQLLTKVGQEKHWQGELWQKTGSEQEILTQTEIKKLAHYDRSQEYFVVIFSDITARKRSEDKLSFLANYDTLTGLPNRGLLHHRLVESIKHEKKGFSLICIDMDHFRHINDSLGHSIGDQLLQRVSIKLQQIIPNNRSTVARLAGDEFALLVPEIVHRKHLESFANIIFETFKTPIHIQGHEIIISPSIGIGRYPQDAVEAISLLKYTESALHFAKAKGRGNHQFYDQDIQSRTMRKMTVGNQLRRALDKNELELVYQPKLDLVDNKIIGMEALLRWHNKNIGAIGPEEFIAIAEETGQVNEIGNWVLKQACEQAKKWQLRGFNIPVSVNISARQFQRQSLFQTVSDTLNITELAPELLELEITETMLLDDPEAAIRTLSQLKQMGVRIAVDDFGTGYSSLSYLKKLPIDTLKIDKAFIQDLASDKDDEAITHAIISLAKNLKLSVIAEGVENDQQLYFLKNAGCQQAQGFLISHPMTAQATTIYCDENLH